MLLRVVKIRVLCPVGSLSHCIVFKMQLEWIKWRTIIINHLRSSIIWERLKIKFAWYRKLGFLRGWVVWRVVNRSLIFGHNLLTHSLLFSLYSSCRLVKLTHCLLHFSSKLRYLILIMNSFVLDLVFKIFLINLDLTKVIFLLRSLLWFLSSLIKYMAIPSNVLLSLSLLVHDILLCFLNYLFNILVLDLHLPLFVLFLKVTVHLLNLHHLLKDKVAVLSWLETSRFISCFTIVRILRSVSLWTSGPS